ncbi:hypothetical protein TWF730_007044 [Orbilia blumenaviensis]|uniref:Uncharacterized protein n=1 Tax=Orbilia blumenaviensis TaxID=1796055 RepID=A0AAV9VIL5_9PEZI
MMNAYGAGYHSGAMYPNSSNNQAHNSSSSEHNINFLSSKIHYDGENGGFAFPPSRVARECPYILQSAVRHQYPRNFAPYNSQLPSQGSVNDDAIDPELYSNPVDLGPPQLQQGYSGSENPTIEYDNWDRYPDSQRENAIDAYNTLSLMGPLDERLNAGSNPVDLGPPQLQQDYFGSGNPTIEYDDWSRYPDSQRENAIDAYSTPSLMGPLDERPNAGALVAPQSFNDTWDLSDPEIRPDSFFFHAPPCLLHTVDAAVGLPTQVYEVETQQQVSPYLVNQTQRSRVLPELVYHSPVARIETANAPRGLYGPLHDQHTSLQTIRLTQQPDLGELHNHLAGPEAGIPPHMYNDGTSVHAPSPRTMLATPTGTRKPRKRAPSRHIRPLDPSSPTLNSPPLVCAHCWFPECPNVMWSEKREKARDNLYHHHQKKAHPGWKKKVHERCWFSELRSPSSSS